MNPTFLETALTVAVIGLPAAAFGFPACAFMVNRRLHNTARRYRHLPRL